MHTKTSKMHPPSLLWQLATVVLLFLYGVGSFPGESFHAIVHPKEVSALHSVENENDACHQSLFHADANKGCEHKTHLVNGSKCAFTQIGHQSLHVVENPPHVYDFVPVVPKLETTDIYFVSAFAGFFSSRAPPVVV